MIAEAVERNGIGQFANVDDAVNVAAMALNYIMLQIGVEEKDPKDDK
jgi:hypothetical protein